MKRFDKICGGIKPIKPIAEKRPVKNRKTATRTDTKTAGKEKP